MRQPAIRRLAVVLVTAIVSALVAVPSAQSIVRTRLVRDVPGTRLVTATIRTKSGPSQVWLDTVDLTDRRLSIEPALANNVLDGPHETVPSMARRTRAVVGINGDFWNWDSDNAGPLHGLMIKGHLYKTPGYRTSANFYVTTDGKAHIGPVNIYTRMQWRTPTGVARSSYAFSTNNVDDMNRQHLVLTTSDLAAVPIPWCTVAYLNQTAAGWAVTRLAHWVSRLTQRTATQRALVACGTRMPVATGEVVRFSQSSTVSGLRALVSGGAQLIRNGRAFRDPAAQLVTGWLNPMTFACVSRDSLHITFGVVDGRRPTSAGINPQLLTAYLLHLGGCYNAMSFDGGGSTTMWARGKVQNVPADGAPRPVADGLFVYRT